MEYGVRCCGNTLSGWGCDALCLLKDYITLSIQVLSEKLLSLSGHLKNDSKLIHTACTKHKMCVTALQVVMFMWATPASLLPPIKVQKNVWYSVLLYFKALLFLSFFSFISKLNTWKRWTWCRSSKSCFRTALWWRCLPLQGWLLISTFI